MRLHRNSTALLIVVGVATLLTPFAAATNLTKPPQDGYDIRLVTDNDWLSSNKTQDDLYTFGLTVEIDKGPLTWTLTENAFTDRTGGYRFDETHLTVGKLLPAHLLGGWSLWLEAGLSHVGKGLLGESVQNEFHRLIGSDSVQLDYIDRSDLHGRIGVVAGRQIPLAEGISTGLQIEADLDIGFRAAGLVGVRSRWTRRGTGPLSRLDVDVTLGARYTRSSLALLEQHLERLSAAATIEVATPGGLVVHWSHNRYGTDRDHIGLGYRFGGGDSPRRSGPWRESVR